MNAAVNMSPETDPTWEARFVFDAYDDEMAMACLTALCEGFIRVNMIWFSEARENAPCCLSHENVQYVLPYGCSPDIPCQSIRSAPEILETGVATCIDICCYVAAQLRLRGRKGAGVSFINMLDANGYPIIGMYHALVRVGGKDIDYTQDLIDGKTARCTADCKRPLRYR